MIINSFKMRTGKPMIDSLESAKEFSLCEDYKDEEIGVWLIDEGSCYISYKNGKKVFDGWSANKEKKRNETK